ncbi:hypothetical protein FAI41_03275 [Acetobacteraceae bacterium]|nr:hypothetical protein FAI41_03275 [Acetobacteraceae bacterium]
MKNLKKESTRFLTMGVAGTAFFLSGCASAVNGSQEKILVYSKPEAAKCKIYQGGQLQKTFETPHRLTLPRSSELDLILNCAKPGYKLFTQVWEPDLTGAYAGNTGWFLASLASLSAFIPASGIFAGGAAYDLAHQSAYGYPKYLSVDFVKLEKGSVNEELPDHFKKPSA